MFLSRLERFFLAWWTGAITAVVTILAGAASSFYSDEIQYTFLTIWVPGRTFAVKSSVFWLLVVIAGLMLGGSQWARAQAAARARRQVDAQVLRLESAVHRIESLPPESFLGSHQEALRHAAKSTLIAMLSPGGTVDDFDVAIRNVLATIIELAGSYDSRADNVVYAANIMVYRPDGRLDASDSHIKLLPVEQGHPDYVGALELIPSLSTTSTSPTSEGDPSVASLVLPIPKNVEPTKDRELRDRYPVLPGAPWAFVYREYVGFPTITELDGWLTQRSSAATADTEAVRAYFRDGAGRNIRSFASMPLNPVTMSEKELPVGVLNLHSDHEGLLATEGGARFAPLLEPFRMLLSILVVQRMARSRLDSGGTT